MPLIANLTRPKGDPKILEVGASSLAWSDRLARNLGWVSCVRGLVALAAAPALTRSAGLTGMETFVRVRGATELVSGIVTLSTERKHGLWMRVAGDMADIAALTRGLHAANPERRNAKLALMIAAGATALDLLAAMAVTRRSHRPASGQRSFTNRSGFPKGVQAARGAAIGKPRPTGAGGGEVLAGAAAGIR